jgi:hypothetical protein
VNARVIPLGPAIRKRLRQDVLRWAQVLNYSPEQSITGDPDAFLDFLATCAEPFQHEFTHAHGSEIFAWHREAFEGAGAGPEAA